MSAKKLTFAVCAYKESRFLEECLKSLVCQREYADIIICTATPCDFIKNMAEKYDIPYYINEGEKGITQDWNFAYSKCETEYVTIAHQDDFYDSHYAETAIKMMDAEKQPIIFFTDYYELRNGKDVKTNKILKVKRLMLAPLKIKAFRTSRFVRRRILSLGSPICCPSVTYNKAMLKAPFFKNHFRTNEDWEAWELLSKYKGSFIYCTEPLTKHRIHEESETSAVIMETGRGAEDYEMYRKFWPAWIAKILLKAYSSSEKSNSL